MLADVQILDATAADLPVLNAIAMASKAHWGYPDEWLELWRDDLTLSEKDLAQFDVYKLLHKAKLIGWCAIIDGEMYEVEHLWLLPVWIGKGLGRVLLEAALQRSVLENKDIVLVADPNSQAFYEALGFEVIGQVKSQPGDRWLPRMRKAAGAQKG